MGVGSRSRSGKILSLRRRVELVVSTVVVVLGLHGRRTHVGEDLGGSDHHGLGFTTGNGERRERSVGKTSRRRRRRKRGTCIQKPHRRRTRKRRTGNSTETRGGRPSGNGIGLLVGIWSNTWRAEGVGQKRCSSTAARRGRSHREQRGGTGAVLGRRAARGSTRQRRRQACGGRCWPWKTGGEAGRSWGRLMGGRRWLWRKGGVGAGR